MDDEEFDYNLTPEQRASLLQLKSAFRKCRKLGIRFWDDYGVFSAYNSELIECPVPDEAYETPLNYRYVEFIPEAGRTDGNADDPLYVKRK